MDDPGGSSYFAALVCLLLSALFSGSETALFSSDKIKLKSSYAQNKAVGGLLELKENPRTILSSILLGNTLVNIMFSSIIATIVYSKLRAARSFVELVATIIGTILILIFGEITPKLIASTNPEWVSIKITFWFNLLQKVMGPVSVFLERLASFFIRMIPANKEKAEELTEARLLATLDYGERNGAIRNDEKEMICGVIESQDLEVKDIMVPRPKMVALQEDKSALEMLKFMLKYGFSRIPIYSDSRDNITGIVNIKDLATVIGEKAHDWESGLSETPCKNFATPPYFVPETKKVSDLFYEMKSKGVYMAIVIDEFDGVSGLVTLEDVIEEIVGDIRDEYDAEEPDFIRLRNGCWQVPGRMSLAELEDATGIAINLKDCDSVAGLVMKLLDRVPVPGDAFCLLQPKICIEVQEVTGPRIQKILIQKIEDKTNCVEGEHDNNE